MASPNATFTELVSTTFRRHGKKFIDNVSKNNALLAWIMRNGVVTEVAGGLTIVKPLDYNANSTYQRYSGYDVLNIAQSDVLTSAEYPWRQIAINVVASGLEMRINKGDTQIIALVKSRVKNAIRTFKNNFSVDLYSDGTLPNQITGLQALVSDAGTGTVGGIDSGNWPFWANAVQSAAAPLQGGAAIVPGPTTMESLMLPLWMNQVRGDDKPNLILSSNDYYSFYEFSQTSIKRYTGDNPHNTATGGFLSLKYKSADVVFDGGSGIPPAHMYFLNTEYWDLVVHEDANMTVLDQVHPFNQDAAVIPVLWMGNTTLSNRRLQGVLKA
ncbi:MAG TPA: phage major capsid protein [Nitrospiraceae bacterium]|nr:phage major capsid protein [Nitrospiraceae bacterium]